MKRKHPIRMCVVCREKSEKRNYHRLVRTEIGIQVDERGKFPGRGAYLCDKPSCWERAIASDVLAKALRCSLQLDDRERLRQAVPI